MPAPVRLATPSLQHSSSLHVLCNRPRSLRAWPAPRAPWLQVRRLPTQPCLLCCARRTHACNALHHHGLTLPRAACCNAATLTGPQVNALITVTCGTSGGRRLPEGSVSIALSASHVSASMCSGKASTSSAAVAIVAVQPAAPTVSLMALGNTPVCAAQRVTARFNYAVTGGSSNVVLTPSVIASDPRATCTAVTRSEGALPLVRRLVLHAYLLPTRPDLVPPACCMLQVLALVAASWW